MHFNQNFIVVGNVPMIQPRPGKLKYFFPLSEGPNWLKPQPKSFTIVMLTFHDTIPLFIDENFEHSERRKSFNS